MEAAFGLGLGSQYWYSSAGQEFSDAVRPGMILIPHGFGLLSDGQVFGLNVNCLTKASHRDPLGTPLHRQVPCRVEAA